VICELVNDDGTVTRGPQVVGFCREARAEAGLGRRSHRLSPAQGNADRACGDSFDVDTPFGKAKAHAYSLPWDPMQHLAIVFGDIRDGIDIPVRLHPENVAERRVRQAIARSINHEAHCRGRPRRHRLSARRFGRRRPSRQRQRGALAGAREPCEARPRKRMAGNRSRRADPEGSRHHLDQAADQHASATMSASKGLASRSPRPRSNRNRAVVFRPTVARGIRGVIFLDPYGMEVDWSTVEAIARTEALDCWYFFPLSGLYRNAPHDPLKLDPGKVENLNRVLGTNDWRTAWYEKPPPETDMLGLFEKTERRIADVDAIEMYVRDRLMRVFKGTVLKPLRIYNAAGAPLASLFFAVSNPSPPAVKLATSIASHILKLGISSQVR
jgi:hypothetical protein